jgi:protein-L-isoaspartate(D-aspartate) O-methyltransferase
MPTMTTKWSVTLSGFGEEFEPDLVVHARSNLRDCPGVTVRHGNGATVLATPVDRVLVHADATHVLDTWLDALSDGGRLMLPLTVEFPGMAGISKGLMLLVTRAAPSGRLRHSEPCRSPSTRSRNCT